MKAALLSVGKLGDFKRGIAGKLAKKAVLADLRAFFSLSAEPKNSLILYGENFQF